MSETTESTVGKPASRKFFYWFLGVQLVPIAGIAGAPGLVKLWVLIVLGNACVFFFNFSRYHSRRKPDADEADMKTERLLLLGACATWGLLVLVWGGAMGLDMYRSGSLGL
jgi:hypothetical protein